MLRAHNNSTSTTNGLLVTSVSVHFSTFET